jgi:septal ring factor EnvC (AmiA/AmiB activator)
VRWAAHFCRRLRRFFVLAGIAISVVSAVPALAGEEAAEKAVELEQLRGRIKSLQADLQNNRKKKTRAEQRLEAVERKISSSTRALKSVDAELTAVRAQLQHLQYESRAAAGDVRFQAGRLADEARAAYAMGRQQQVKLLLNQEQPAAMGRMLTYFTYLSRARTERIETMRTTIDRLNALETDIDLQTQNLVDLRDTQKDGFDTLQSQKNQRKQLIASLSGQLAAQGNELEHLQENEKQLQALVYSLQELLSDIPPDANQHRPFKSLKGKLRWPAKGHLSRRFGTQRGSSGLTWQGVLITAPEGGQVRAVSQGRVAFADWLRGFGLLLIIDHGDGYMSLYGQNQALYKEVGEWVDSGEVVATSGASGGQTNAGLYFELRHKGRPENPVKWCAGKPGAVPG